MLGRVGRATGRDGRHDGGVSSSGTTRAVFRASWLAYAFALLLLLAATPLLLGPWYLRPVLLVPLWAILRAARTRTVVDAEGLSVRRLVRTRHVPWEAVEAVHQDARGSLFAVLESGRPLMMGGASVRDRDTLAAASGGRMPEPTKP